MPKIDSWQSWSPSRLAPWATPNFCGQTERSRAAKTAGSYPRIDLTWDELKAQDYRIVIEEQGSPP